MRALDPPGVGAFDLPDCLMLQIRALGIENPLIEQIVTAHWQEFLNRQFTQLSRTLNVGLAQIQAVVEIIKNMEPKPGRKYSDERTIYVEPDVGVRKIGDEYVIQLNEDGLPKLRISAAYRRMLRGGNGAIGEEAANYLKDKMRSAIWLIKSLDQRQRTIYKVADSIVRHQREFLEHGIEHLRPLVLRDVANDIGMHESTVSRVVSNKYIHTPRGLFPMKYFFHSGIDSTQGSEVSSLSIKSKIAKIVLGRRHEPPALRRADHAEASRRGDPDRPADCREVPRGAAHPLVLPAQAEFLDGRPDGRRMHGSQRGSHPGSEEPRAGARRTAGAPPGRSGRRPDRPLPREAPFRGGNHRDAPTTAVERARIHEHRPEGRCRARFREDRRAGDEGLREEAEPEEPGLAHDSWSPRRRRLRRPPRAKPRGVRLPRRCVASSA